MNIGQVLETHLGSAAQVLGFKAITPVFDGASDVTIEDALSRLWLAREAGAVTIKPDSNRTSLKIELAKEWLGNKGYDGDRVFSDDFRGEAREVCLRLWLEGLVIDSHKLNLEELEDTANRVAFECEVPRSQHSQRIKRVNVRRLNPVRVQELHVDDALETWMGDFVFLLRGSDSDRRRLPAREVTVVNTHCRLERGLNALWTKGGLMYAAPIR